MRHIQCSAPSEIAPSSTSVPLSQSSYKPVEVSDQAGSGNMNSREDLVRVLEEAWSFLSKYDKYLIFAYPVIFIEDKWKA